MEKKQIEKIVRKNFQYQNRSGLGFLEKDIVQCVEDLFGLFNSKLADINTATERIGEGYIPIEKDLGNPETAEIFLLNGRAYAVDPRAGFINRIVSRDDLGPLLCRCVRVNKIDRPEDLFGPAFYQVSRKDHKQYKP